jgi:hypothetical protein
MMHYTWKSKPTGKESSDDVIQGEDLREKKPVANRFWYSRRSVLE